MSTDVLQVEGLSIEFAGVKALQELAFHVPADGVTAVIGPNGAGKTTLLNCVTGLYRPRGSIRFDGAELVGRSAQECTASGIARTFQTPALVPELSVLDNVMLGAHARTTGGVLAAVLGLRGTRSRDRALAQEARDVLGRLVPEVAPDAAVTGLPHRERRLVEIARGLLGHPRLLLLDEPAAGSTATEAADMLARTQAVAQEAGSVIVLVEHNVPLVMSVARHVVVLDHGALLAQGTPAAVRADDRVVEAYLGTLA